MNKVCAHTIRAARLGKGWFYIVGDKAGLRLQKPEKKPTGSKE